MLTGHTTPASLYVLSLLDPLVLSFLIPSSNVTSDATTPRGAPIMVMESQASILLQDEEVAMIFLRLLISTAIHQPGQRSQWDSQPERFSEEFQNLPSTHCGTRSLISSFLKKKTR